SIGSACALPVRGSAPKGRLMSRPTSSTLVSCVGFGGERRPRAITAIASQTSKSSSSSSDTTSTATPSSRRSINAWRISADAPLCGIETSSSDAVELDRRGIVDRPLARQRGEQLCLAVAGHTRDAHDLATSNSKLDIDQIGAERIVGLERKPLDEQRAVAALARLPVPG